MATSALPSNRRRGLITGPGSTSMRSVLAPSASSGRILAATFAWSRPSRYRCSRTISAASRSRNPSKVALVHRSTIRLRTASGRLKPDTSSRVGRPRSMVYSSTMASPLGPLEPAAGTSPGNAGNRRPRTRVSK